MVIEKQGDSNTKDGDTQQAELSVALSTVWLPTLHLRMCGWLSKVAACF